MKYKLVKIDENTSVVEGSFDDWYEENIGKHLRAEVRSVKDPNALGIFKPEDKSRMRIKDWREVIEATNRLCED